MRGDRSMWLLDKFLRKFINKGELTVIDHKGATRRYGSPDPLHGPITVRLMDARVAGEIVRNPRLALGEAYMDGRLVIEDGGDIRDFLLFAIYNAPWEREGPLEPRGPIRRTANYVAGKLDQINRRTRSRRNAEHTYNLTRRLYELFLDADRQYTCAYYRDTANSLEKAQLDKKAHIAAKLHLKAGMRVLDVGCGWGGTSHYLHRH
jgi:cyclopropane-fatty-acyl-phospholipid synthase